MVILDTNVISELVAKRPNAHVVGWIDSLDPSDIYLSVVTIGEIRKGVARLPHSPRKELLQLWLQGDLLKRFASRVLILDIHTMLHWGELTARLDQAGMSMPAMDSLIAAQALVHGCALATRNASHFAAAGVTVVNPWDLAQP